MKMEKPNLPEFDQLTYVRIMFNCEAYVENTGGQDNVFQIFSLRSKTLTVEELEKTIVKYFCCPTCVKRPVLNVHLSSPEAWIVSITELIGNDDIAAIEELAGFSAG